MSQVVPPRDDQKELFELVDEFDPPDFTKLPFVRVAMGHSFRVDGHPREIVYRYGFLVEARGRQFTVRYLRFSRGILTMSTPPSPVHVPRTRGVYDRFGFDPMDIRAYARQLAAERAAEVLPTGWSLSSVDAILLARRLARRGHQRELNLVWPTTSTGELRRDLGTAIAIQLTLDFGDRDISRADLAKRHRTWLREFPKLASRYKFLLTRSDLLDRMVAEDRKHRDVPQARKSPTDLVSDLRDEYHAVDARRIQNFSVAPVVPTAPDELTPIRALEKLGLKAVPALIDALGDERPTRCVMYLRRYGGSYWIMPIRSTAHDLLERIRGEPLPRTMSAEWWRDWYEKSRRQF